ncbi:MAG TPA: hypothetical protein VK866_13910 [Acidimicrobiales bacterium]|nr:hypothetical protein [Acidimicrobiales bacterium]
MASGGGRPDPVPAPELVEWCRRHLGAPAVERFFGADHLSAVHGLRLDDGRAVVLKVRWPDPRLRGCGVVHRIVHAAGVPCPPPLTGPHPIDTPDGERWCSAEGWVPGGRRAPDGDVAVQYAQLAARIVAIGPSPGAVPSLAPPPGWVWFDHDAPDRVWPPAATPQWDPHRIEAELPPFLVEAARRSRARLLADDARALPDVVAHVDLSGFNVRWFPPYEPGGPWRPLVHDWDSVAARSDAVVAGVVAADHASLEAERLATVDDSARVVDEYARVRGRAFTAAEREVAWAAGVWVSAYNAAFEHLHGAAGPVTAALGEQLDERLARAGA